MKVIVLGFGKIGRTICDMLKSVGRYEIVVGEADDKMLAEAAALNIQTVKVNVTDHGSLSAALKGKDIVINALPHHLNLVVSTAAVESRVNYFDLSEDVASTRHIKMLASKSTTALMPQCGLAPGFIAIAAYDLVQRFDKVKDVMCRVGALPIYPTNAMKYNLTWSTDGLINEYCMPCEAIHDGQLREVLPLEGLENFSLDGVEYECFNTSGGIGTLCDTMAGKVENLNYKTIRYPGHCDIARLLVNELGLAHKRNILKDVLEASVPMTMQDEVIVFVSVCGWRGSHLVQENFLRKIYGREVAGELRSAIQITTAAGICGVVDMFAQGKLPKSGLIKQEQVSLSDFMATPFGQYYNDPMQLRKAA